ncbi:MAG: lytic transglycosylase domain-containing protein [Acidobacteriota bacterium]|nr:lytic transglycosylase domain-containing protein [Acidobacteriota bacterium]
MRVLRLTAVLMLLAGCSFAAEVAELRNGFRISHRCREERGETVRLYLDEQHKSFLDVARADIAGYSTEPDPTETLAAKISRAPADSGKNTDQIVSEAAENEGVDSDFIRSVIQQESAGNARAVSPAGARGLMQLMPGTAAQLGVQDSFNPEQNVHGGTAYLRELLERYHGDAIKALAAYNAGPAAVDRYQGVPPYRETRAYVSRIVHEYNQKKSASLPRGAKKAATASKRGNAEKSPEARKLRPAAARRTNANSAKAASREAAQSSRINTASADHRLSLTTALAR